MPPLYYFTNHVKDHDLYKLDKEYKSWSKKISQQLDKILKNNKKAYELKIDGQTYYILADSFEEAEERAKELYEKSFDFRNVSKSNNFFPNTL